MLLRLDLQFFSEEKTEEATPRKRQDEREKGRVAKSQDVNTSFILLFSFLGFMSFGSFMKEGLLELYSVSFIEFFHWDLTIESLNKMFIMLLSSIAKIVVPIMLVTMFAAIASNLLQVGFLFTTEPLKFDLTRLDPIQGAKRIFSIRALVELLKSMFKIVFIGSVTFGILWLNRDEMFMAAFKSPENALSFFARTTLIMGIAATIALLFLSILDYLYQRYDHEKNIRMSKKDIKDEHKDIEGDPLIQSKIKEKQKEIAMRRMMSEVPHADVVITNPTHYSVAIRYDESISDTPYVVAKGKDNIALKIREIAKNHQVQIVENRPLAYALFNEVDLEQKIPERFFKDVAEVLAYVYSVENRVG